MTSSVAAVQDIEPKGVDAVLPAIPCVSSLLIHTGNIINRGFIYKRSPSVPEEIKITCAKTVGKWLAGVNKHESKNLTSVEMDYNRIVNAGPPLLEERKNLKVTVKLFVVNAGPDCVKEALNKVGEKLKTRHVETLILSLPGTSHGATVTYKGLVGPYWEAAESVCDFTFNDHAHHSECAQGCDSDENQQEESVGPDDSLGVDSPRSVSSRNEARIGSRKRDVRISWTVGLSDLNVSSLRDVYENAQTVKPSIDQINMDACCSPPEDLVTVCKDNDIQLLTHNDPRDILSQDVLQEILSAHLDHHKDLVGWQVAWVLRYSALVKCRGIIHTKGYIVHFNRSPPDFLSQ